MPGRLEDLPGGFFLVFGELTENFTRRRNDQLLKKVRSLATAHGHLCLPWSWTTGGSIVCLLEDGRKVTLYSARARFDTLSTGRCLSGRPTSTNVTITTTRPDNNYVV